MGSGIETARQNMKLSKVYGFSNSYFWVAQVSDNVILAILLWHDIPAEAWNKLRDDICNYTKITDDTTVYFDYLYINGDTDRFSYVTVGDWRRLGFSGNNIKNCIKGISFPSDKVVDESNEYFFKNIEKLQTSGMPPRRKERIVKMITREHYIKSFKTAAIAIHSHLSALGMTDEEITEWFIRVLREGYYPKK